MKKMRYGIKYSRGSLILVPFPFTDLSATKRRPALVISPDRYNEKGEDLILLAVTSKFPSELSEIEIPLEKADLKEGILPKRSIVRLSKIFTMHSGLMVKKAGSLKDRKIREILDRLITFLMA